MIRGGQPYYYSFDGNGNVIDLTTSTGTIAASYQYDAFGVPVQTSGAIRDAYTFAGLDYDSASDLYYADARYYDPSTGRFLSQDPVASVNPYPYAGSDPVNYADPSGRHVPIDHRWACLGHLLAGLWRQRGQGGSGWQPGGRGD